MREALTLGGRNFQMDYILGATCAVFLFFYLLYALLKPERF
ncbi:MAG: K(+)-transporting ATPase subunit F [Bryobacterales bacterium]|nr:K(+)-transporting ATPase subunit F [Bryobacterales bacterium]